MLLNRNRRGGQQQMGEKHDGPNWVLIAGGALVTVVSFVIGQRESLPKGRELEKRKDNNGKPKPASGTEYCGHQSDSHVEGASSHLSSRLQMQSHRTKYCEQEVHSTPEPVKESYMTPPCSNEEQQCSSPAPVALQTMAKCNMVRRLHQQLKRRDGMIFDMQEQIVDRDHAVAFHQERIVSLELQLQESSNFLFDSAQEVQRLQWVLAERSDKPDASLKDCNGFDYGKILKSLNMEVGRLAAEVAHLKVENGELSEKVTCLEREKREKALLSQAMSLEHEKLVHKVFKLETELQEGRRSALEKDQLFEVNEHNRSEKTNSLHHKHKLEAQKKKLEKVRHSQASKQVDSHNSNSRVQRVGNDEPPTGRNSHTKALTGHMGMVNSSCSCTGSAAHTLSSAVLRSDDSNLNVANFKASSNGRCQVKARGLSNGREKTMTKITASDPATNEIIVRAPQQEVQQFATGLATLSNMTSAGGIDDDVKERMDRMTPVRLKSDEPNWAELSQHLFLSAGATSPTQVKELSHKLELVARERRMKEEIAQLKKHQAKIAELKQRVGKLTTKCRLWYAQTREDKVHVQHTLQVAALILELADRLTAQEEQARKTSIEVQQSSVSFQPLSTNITKSKKEDVQKGGDSANVPTHTNGDGNYRAPPRYTAHDKTPRENCDISFNPPISFASAEEVARPNSDDQELHSIPSQRTEETYNVTLATLSPPASKIQNLFSDRAVKESSTSRKQPVSHENRSSCSKKNSSPLEQVQSNASAILAVAPEGLPKYSDPESSSHLVNKSHNLASDQQMGGHQRQSMEEEVSLLALEIEQVMAKTSAVPLLSSLPQDPRFSSFVNSLAVPVESPTVPADSRNLTTYWFDDVDYIDDGELLVDPLHSRSDGFTEYQEEEKGETEDEDTSSGNYTWNPGHRIQTYYSESATPSPFSKMVACLDLKQPSSTTSIRESEIYWKDTMFLANMSGGEALDNDKACKLSTHTGTGGKESGGSESRGSSIDSAFNEILDHTLEDLVKICSTATTPTGTPSSSAFSPGSVSNHVQQQQF